MRGAPLFLPPIPNLASVSCAKDRLYTVKNRAMAVQWKFPRAIIYASHCIVYPDTEIAGDSVSFAWVKWIACRS